MENEYLQVTLLPQLGGRIYQLVFKPTGSNELYQNPVIKPTHWGPLAWYENWWLSAGGIEWCLPVNEHGYEFGEPWTWSAITSTAGVTVTVSDSSAPDRLMAAIDIHLPSGRSVLTVRPRLENPTGTELTYEFWINAALSPGPGNVPTAGLEFIFNASEMSVHSTGDATFPCPWQDPGGPNCRFSWPDYAGRDWSLLGNWDEWLGFFEYPQAAADFMGVYSHDAEEGVARVFPSAVVRGAKGFAYGWSNPIDWHEWTDDGSSTVELHGGVTPTFWSTASLAAGETISWTEYWYPVADIGSISAATADAALGVRLSAGSLQIGVQPTSAWGTSETELYLWDEGTCQTLAYWDLPAVNPGEPFRAAAHFGGRTLAEISLAYVSTSGKLLAALDEVDCLPPRATVDTLPQWVGTAAFTVTWSGEDAWTGLDSFDLQVRPGYEQPWSDWLTDTTDLSAVFTGTHAHTYFFRARASDLAGNRSEYGEAEWGQAYTSVLTEPAPVLVTTRKQAVTRPIGVSSRPTWFHPDETIAYTLLVSNTGNLTGAVRLTDTLPSELSLLTHTLAASDGSPAWHAGGSILWTGDVQPGGSLTISYSLSPTLSTPFGVSLTNTLRVAGSVLGPLTRSAAVVQVYRTWLPLLLRTGAAW
jgi:uncharacterized repeat protein (TIGR01451 family)